MQILPTYIGTWASRDWVSKERAWASIDRVSIEGLGIKIPRVLMDNCIKHVKIYQAVHFKYGQLMCANYNSIKLLPLTAFFLNLFFFGRKIPEHLTSLEILCCWKQPVQTQALYSSFVHNRLWQPFCLLIFILADHRLSACSHHVCYEEHRAGLLLLAGHCCPLIQPGGKYDVTISFFWAVVAWHHLGLNHSVGES